MCNRRKTIIKIFAAIKYDDVAMPDVLILRRLNDNLLVGITGSDFLGIDGLCLVLIAFPKKDQTTFQIATFCREFGSSFSPLHVALNFYISLQGLQSNQHST